MRLVVVLVLDVFEFALESAVAVRHVCEPRGKQSRVEGDVLDGVVAHPDALGGGADLVVELEHWGLQLDWGLIIGQENRARAGKKYTARLRGIL